MLSEEKGRPDQFKQWFVFVEDRYRGPYTHSQIISTIQQGGLGGANLIWKEGMVDWETLAKVAEFNSAGSTALADPHLSQSALSFLDYMETEDDLPAALPPTAAEEIRAPKAHIPAAPPLAFNADFWIPESERKVPFWRKKTATLAGLSAGAVIFALSLWHFTRSGFPVLKDLNAREARELSAIAADDIYSGDSAGAALAPGNSREPRFYLASNTADGTVLEARLEGLRDTLLDSFHYDSSVAVKVKNHFAKTPAFVQDGGKPLSPGEYTLTIAKEGSILSQKTFFLGGTKDREYAEKLKAYQAKLRIQSEGELAEIRQVTELLEKQFAESNQRFRSGKGWDKFHGQWLALQGQIEILFQDVSPAILNREFYHGPLYGLLKEATAEVSRLHAEQHSAVTLGAADQNKLSDATRTAHSRLLSLRAKVLQAERQAGI